MVLTGIDNKYTPYPNRDNNTAHLTQHPQGLIGSSCCITMGYSCGRGSRTSSRQRSSFCKSTTQSTTGIRSTAALSRNSFARRKAPTLPWQRASIRKLHSWNGHAINSEFYGRQRKKGAPKRWGNFRERRTKESAGEFVKDIYSVSSRMAKGECGDLVMKEGPDIRHLLCVDVLLRGKFCVRTLQQCEIFGIP